MKTGSIRIIIEEGKTPSIEAELVDNNLWISKWAMARLFNCYFQKIEMNLRSIFKNKLLYEDNVSYAYRYIDKGIEKQTVYYNLEVLIFLSYRIATFEAQVFRQFIISALREHLQKKETQKCPKLIWHFRHSQDYWMN
ncbi:MAG: hypothetical protein LBE79_02010 [Tannerella sp.]|jgi:hypothetical protein|nr:hypothetical protein [Tannerella sp.]